MRTGQLRLRRVRFKDGRTVEVFRSRTKEQDRADVLHYVKRALDGHDDRVSGFAFVAWTSDGASTAEMKVWEARPVPKIMAPDFVRERLMHEVHEDWILKTIDERDQ